LQLGVATLTIPPRSGFPACRGPSPFTPWRHPPWSSAPADRPTPAPCHLPWPPRAY